MAKIIQLSDADGYVYPNMELKSATLSHASGWSDATTSIVTKSGREVNVVFGFNSSSLTANAWNVCCDNIPSGYRPSNAIRFPAFNDSGNAIILGMIGTDGKISVYVHNEGTVYVRGSVSYMI